MNEKDKQDFIAYLCNNGFFWEDAARIVLFPEMMTHEELMKLAKLAIKEMDEINRILKQIWA